MKGIFLCLLVTVACVFGAEEVDKRCSKKVESLNKKKFESVAICTKEIPYKNGRDKAAKTSCVMKCVMIREKLLSSDGTIDAAQADAFIKDTLFPEHGEVFRPLLMNCVDTVGKNLDPKEEYCKSYGEFISCLLKIKFTGC